MEQVDERSGNKRASRKAAQLLQQRRHDSRGLPHRPAAQVARSRARARARDKRSAHRRPGQKRLRRLYVRERPGADRAELPDQAHAALRPQPHGANADGAVRLKELHAGDPLRQHAHHEPVELPLPFDHRPTGRRHRRGQHGHPEAERLLSCHQCGDPRDR